MEVSNILELCNNLNHAYIVEYLSKEDLINLKEYLNREIVIDANEYNDTKYDNITSFLPQEVNDKHIIIQLNRMRLLTDIFKQFVKKNILLPFSEDFLNRYNEIIDSKSFEEFREKFYFSFNYDDLDRAGKFLKYKSTLLINVLINKDFQNIFMQQELNTLLDNNNQYKTRFFIEGKKLITYINSDGKFINNFETKILTKK